MSTKNKQQHSQSASVSNKYLIMPYSIVICPINDTSDFHKIAA